MWFGTRLECIGSLPRVSGACQDGTREFVGRRPRLAGRLSRVAEKVTGIRKDFAESIGKIARSTPGDHQRKTVRLTVENVIGCRIVGVRLVVMYGYNP
ncbi:hypothetical protein BHE74_00046572 [Ensete ventricosum]|nr:hypothetical protein BHE74_00046572 [Ensete ventricosum]